MRWEFQKWTFIKAQRHLIWFQLLNERNLKIYIDTMKLLEEFETNRMKETVETISFLLKKSPRNEKEECENRKQSQISAKKNFSDSTLID